MQCTIFNKPAIIIFYETRKFNLVPDLGDLLSIRNNKDVCEMYFNTFSPSHVTINEVTQVNYFILILLECALH